ncbi:MAG: DNA gyrase/topoisomerase IV subunit A [Bacteroidetes bacterium]|nr:DNA gyrase/topoisomerase IV subunit A [Bacteroidota bacterium]
MQDNDDIKDVFPEGEDFDADSGQKGSGSHVPEVLKKEDAFKTIHLSGMYQNWFLDYASYVILERAVPDVYDGLKPVQRRILHAMKELDDGRYNKVANIIGHTMKYHPHGDASIGDALVQLGQKDILIDTQGNWGNIHTGDSAAAPRYIEARLSKFALEVVFNPKTTHWKLSYDGRNKEPLALPVKFPLLLAQGVEGIAVGLASKILPHNFIELIDASINILQEKDFIILPDFPTGGLADFSKYQDGSRGGRVRIRARINKMDNRTLAVTEIPFGTTTSTLIDSIVAANDKGKIKIRKIDDNTAENVEVLIHLNQGVSPDQTIDALYAFTSCEVSVSPNCCVIEEGKPRFIDVKEILRISVRNTVNLLTRELQIRMAELEEQWHFSSLEKIFIEKRIYRKIETCESWEEVIETIDKGLAPYVKMFKRAITRDDIAQLTEIKIKRISKYNSFKADELIKSIETEMEEVANHLEHIIDYSINYYRQIRKKYGKGRERKTEIRNFDTIEAVSVAAATQKLYVNREEGFAGTALRKDEYVCDCSDIDDIIVFRSDGTFLVTKIASKVFVGKNIIHIDVFRRNDERTIYNVVYRDGKGGASYVKRFAVLGVTRDKEYDLTIGSENSKILYFSANPNGEAEVIKVLLKPLPRLKTKSFEYAFSDLAIKGRNSKGNILTRKPVLKIQKQEEGISTLGAMHLWYDETVRRLNTDERGKYLGAFKGDDKIFTIMRSGSWKLYGFDLSLHFEEDMAYIGKFDPKGIVSVVYFDGEQEVHYLKRFHVEDSDKKTGFLNDHPGTRMVAFSLDYLPRLEMDLTKKSAKSPKESIMLSVADFIAIKSHKAKGKRLSVHQVSKVRWLEPIPVEVNMEEIPEEENGTPVNEDIQETPTSPEMEPVTNEDITKSSLEKQDDDSENHGGAQQMTFDF